MTAVQITRREIIVGSADGFVYRYDVGRGLYSKERSFRNRENSLLILRIVIKSPKRSLHRISPFVKLLAKYAVILLPVPFVPYGWAKAVYSFRVKTALFDC